jgi:WD40 repeat protein
LLSLKAGEDEQSIEAIEFCNEDKFVIFGALNHSLNILDLTTMQIRTKVNLGTENICKLLTSAMSDYLVYLSVDSGYFAVFDVRGNGEFTQKEKMHSDVISDFVINKDENYAITSSLDGTINMTKIVKLND